MLNFWVVYGKPIPSQIKLHVDSVHAPPTHETFVTVVFALEEFEAFPALLPLDQDPSSSPTLQPSSLHA